MAKITYNDKVALIVNPDIADENKVTDNDMNEIKEVVNENDDKFLTNGLNVSNEVDEDYRVNVLHSKNLFDEILEIGTLDSNGINIDTSVRLRCKNYIPVKPNTTYSISYTKVSSNLKLYFSYYNKNDYTTARLSNSEWFTATTFTITTPANCNYLRFVIGLTNDGTISSTDIISNVMINEGSTALPYEPYITPSINVDGEMLVSKNVYSTKEVVIGEWLGKPLYRKVIEITNPTLDAWASVNHNIANMDFGRIIDATLTRTSSGTTSYIPIGIENVSSGALFTCNLQKTIFQYKIAVYTNITKLTAVLEYTKTTD